MLRMPSWALLPKVGIDDPDRAAAGSVVAGQRTQHRARAGDRLGLDERRRVQYAVAEESLQHGAVGVDRPEALDRYGRAVHVLPTPVDDASIVHHGGREVVQVVRRNLTLIRTVGIHGPQDAHRVKKQ
jgi:hypothetical protein